MAQSPEYPDLLFVPPRAWSQGRDGKAVRYIVVHYTAGSERSTSAEDGAAYDQRRTDGTSTHYFVDSNSVVQCVRTTDRANAALHRGNRLGIQYELCGTVQTRAQWLDAASDATLTNAARQIARDCIRYAIPVRRLSVAETRAAWTQFPTGPKGIVGHVDCTSAYPEDGGDHTDPGTEFPWDILLSRVQQFIAGGVLAGGSEDDMAVPEADWQALDFFTRAMRDGKTVMEGSPVKGAPVWPVVQLRLIGAKLDELLGRPALVVTEEVVDVLAEQIALVLGERPDNPVTTAEHKAAVKGAVAELLREGIGAAP